MGWWWDWGYAVDGGTAPVVGDTRVTEAGDTRVTEAGDTRVVE
jgi:hypothetical protein